MNAKGDANRSVRQTKQRLYEALIHLLQQKSLREITVRELTEIAGISRGTFYFHYADIYALMEQMESVQLARLESLMDNLIPNISREDVPPALTALFSYMNDNPEVCHAFYGKNWESDFTRNAKELIARRCLGQLQANGGGTQRQQYLLAFAVNGVVKALLKKFYEMLSVVRKVQEGDLEQRVYEPGRDEMGEMSTQFNKMLDRISVLMAENVNREVLIKNTEIKALQNQINAHFIYNVLEAVKMMAEIKEEYEISDSVTALGELLRYGMKWTSSDVTIRQEMEYIKNYIQLMNLRYDFAILLSIRIPDYIYEQQVPKMSLQPIVENAIIHGIEETENDATIYIKAVCRDEDYEIEITDSGQGMDENQVELLKKKVSGEIEVSGGSGNGIGLKNVQDRIHIRFGESFGLHFASKEGCFTKVSIRLPYTHREAEGNLNGSHENGLFHER